MQEKIELNKIRTLGEIIDDSIQFFKQNWRPLLRSYFTICGFFWVVSFVIAIFNQVQTAQRLAMGESQFGGTYFLSMFFDFISGIVIILTVLSFIALYKEKQNEAPTTEEVWSYFKYYFFRIFGSYLALIVCIAAGFLCCIIPGLYLAVVFSIIFPIMVMENSTFGYAFSRSFKLIKNRWWNVLGVIIVSEIIIVVAMFSVGIPVTIVVVSTKFLTNVNPETIGRFATVIVTHLLQFLYPIPLIAITLSYFSLTEEKDEGALYERINNIGRHDEGINDLTEEY
jgi:hypothetical protein